MSPRLRRRGPDGGLCHQMAPHCPLGLRRKNDLTELAAHGRTREGRRTERHVVCAGAACGPLHVDSNGSHLARRTVSNERWHRKPGSALTAQEQRTDTWQVALRTRGTSDQDMAFYEDGIHVDTEALRDVPPAVQGNLEKVSKDVEDTPAGQHPRGAGVDLTHPHHDVPWRQEWMSHARRLMSTCRAVDITHLHRHVGCRSGLVTPSPCVPWDPGVDTTHMMVKPSHACSVPPSLSLPSIPWPPYRFWTPPRSFPFSVTLTTFTSQCKCHVFREALWK
jgi:hypothetical protein